MQINDIIKEKGVTSLGNKTLRLELKVIQLDYSVDLLEKKLKDSNITPAEETLIEKQIKQERELRETIQKRIEVNVDA